MRTTLSAALLAALLLPAAARAAEDAVQTTEATGQAAVAGDLLAARERAKDDALRSCVQQVATTIVTAATETDQAQLLSDKIYSHSVGYVRRFQILDDQQDGNTWVTRLRCEVSEAKLDEDLLAFGIAYRRAGMPRVLVLVAEQAIDATQATGWWQGGGNSADLRVVENAFMDRMEKSGFTFVDAEVLQGKVKLEAIGADPERPAGAGDRGEDRRRAGDRGAGHRQAAGRDPHRQRHLLLLGGQRLGPRGPHRHRRGGGRRRVHLPGRQGLRAVHRRPQRALRGGPACWPREMFSRVGKVWTREQSGLRRIALTVRGVEDYGRLAAFKSVLVNSVRGVKDVQERSMEDGRAELEVALSSTSQAFATDLATRKFQGFAVQGAQGDRQRRRGGAQVNPRHAARCWPWRCALAAARARRTRPAATVTFLDGEATRTAAGKIEPLARGERALGGRRGRDPAPDPRWS